MRYGIEFRQKGRWSSVKKQAHYWGLCVKKRCNYLRGFYRHACEKKSSENRVYLDESEFCSTRSYRDSGWVPRGQKRKVGYNEITALYALSLPVRCVHAG